MRYNCGHDGCDICGGRECKDLSLQKIGKFITCSYCLVRAIELSVSLSGQFGGTIIDVSKPCGKTPRTGAKGET